MLRDLRQHFYYYSRDKSTADAPNYVYVGSTWRWMLVQWFRNRIPHNLHVFSRRVCTMQRNSREKFEYRKKQFS